MQIYSVFHALSNGVVFILHEVKNLPYLICYRKSGYFLLKSSKFWAKSAHLRTRPRYWWDKAVVKISWRSEEFFGGYHVNGRPDTLTDFRVYSLFKYTKNRWFFKYIMPNIPFVSTYQTGIFIIDSPHGSTSYDIKRWKKNYSGSSGIYGKVGWVMGVWRALAQVLYCRESSQKLWCFLV